MDENEFDQGAYNALMKFNPSLCDSIVELIRKGRTPEQISNRLGSSSPFMKTVILSAAHYVEDKIKAGEM